ncbi:hypothetical protein F5X68DRAFT_236372 [Plectosphaerella plurivora]|uniref:Uncharacterized protein n=1 Tax=Plectosphaerella plurivora TaxID=936078 RepID=A0A9P8V2K0_9PEZI|nr:hypothetical protein F5X68DRAFT_236372 [Plectosphaerella plurivora]
MPDFQFVNISRPSDSVKHRRKVRSHAARAIKRDDAVLRQPDPAPTTTTTTAPDADAEAGNDKPWSLTAADSIIAMPLTSVLSPATPDPFTSWIRPLSPFENFLLKHFIQNVVIADLSPQPLPMLMLPPTSSSSPSLPRLSWTQAAAMDAGMLSAVFLAAARSLSRRQHPEIYAPVALRYKAECLRLLNLAIASEGPVTSEATITKTLALASEELFAGSKTTADRHLQAAAFMVHARGRPARIAMWRHDDNIHMWTHWEDIMAGVDSDTICQYAVAQHFALSLRQSHSPSPTSLPENNSLSFEIS